MEAFNMYVSFVQVVGRWAHISRFMLKASLLAWGKLNRELSLRDGRGPLVLIFGVRGFFILMSLFF